jgi:hypothetical protein
MRRRPIGPQSDVIRMAVVAERCRIACRTILSDAKLRKPRQRNPYGESRIMMKLRKNQFENQPEVASGFPDLISII